MISVVLHDSRSTNIFLKWHENERQCFFVGSKRLLVSTARVLLDTTKTWHRESMTVAQGVCIYVISLHLII